MTQCDEPKIGHLKSDDRVRRCFPSGLMGDAINIVLAAAGSNLRTLPRRFCFALRDWLADWLGPSYVPHSSPFVAGTAFFRDGYVAQARPAASFGCCARDAIATKAAHASNRITPRHQDRD